MDIALRYLVLSIIPSLLAYYFAPRFGRGRKRWAIACFFTSYPGLILLGILPTQAIPTLESYRRQHPNCARNGGGMTCVHCGSRSIRLWRQQVLLSVRHYHRCNHCGKTLYTS
ncbi:hypothetical protein [Cupriavidus alkaliphilus]|uniref:DNA-directed RNA polymerase subunit RPC12/RpoP n=1 Tax=Cupriavidus alkaliphilus TaxID=942866 RepID=A0A7W4YV55_9BURK|nr:hypothetical protein [Cupriavidus alkaliphilus]MBB3011262.1 DNA-directed RNA polymerase subunit RPC12/RpoP [Cupriavidus alkaliphilus]